MIGLTFCSGIGAPEVAAPWIDWRLASEIEPFPRAVLQHRFSYQLPESHNQGDPLLWGDMTDITPELLRARGIPLPDLIVAGTPCQDFSVAGLRKGLEGERGNLTLAFVEILHAIVAAKPDGKLAALWENVPGVLSDKRNAFGCFLGGIVGAMDALVPSPRPAPGKSSEHWTWHKGGKVEILDDDGEPTGKFVTTKPHHKLSWPSEGMVEGPRARAAWAVLDAQWFGVAQRRERVFVVVDFGGALDPAAVLLEPDSLRGHHPPRRETGQIAPTIPARSTGGGGLGTDFDLDSGLIEAFGGGRRSGPVEAAACLTAKGQRIDFEVETFIAHTLRGEGFDASEDGTGRGTPLVPVSIAENQRGEIRMSETMAQLTCGVGKPGQGFPAVFAPITAHTLRAQANLAHQADRDTIIPVAGPLTAGMGKSAARMPHEQGALIPVAFDCKGTEVQFTTDGSHPTLRAMGHSGSHQNAGGHAAIAYGISNQPTPKFGVDVCPSLDAKASGGGRMEAVAFAIQERATSINPKTGPDGKGYREDDAAYTLEARSVPQAVATPWAVRRLMPLECERLQGFPDDHTRIPDWKGWRKVEDGEDIAEMEAAGLTIKRTKKSTLVNDPDGPRYKAIGNSMAVPVIRWILERMAVSMGHRRLQA